MAFEIPSYCAPDFTQEKFRSAPDVRWAPAPKDGVIASINVQKGASVAANDTLATLN